MHFSDNCCGEQFFFTRVVVLIFSLIRVLCAVLYRSVLGSLFPFPSNYKQHALGLFPSLCPPHTPTQLQSVEDHLPARNLRAFSVSSQASQAFKGANRCRFRDRANLRTRNPPASSAPNKGGYGVGRKWTRERWSKRRRTTLPDRRRDTFPARLGKTHTY